MAKRKNIEGFSGGLYQPYGPYQRYGIIFGEGRRVRENNINWRADYVSRDTLGKALVQGWRNGCPIPYEVIFEIYKSPEKALNRYLDVNDTFEEAVLELSTVRPGSSITRQLLEHVGRENGETKYLRHEPENVPDRHLDRIAPLGHSYALPRVLIDIREKSIVQGEARQDLEYVTLLDAATVSQNRLELLARVGEGAIRLGVPQADVIRQVLSLGNLREQRNYLQYALLFQIIREPGVAPELFDYYQSMTVEEKRANNTIHFREERNPDTGNKSRFTCRPR